MGKEQELLEAARTGNVAVIERLLASRVRRSAGGSALSSALASLWNFKGVNVNCVDANGGTPLHLASLNGHREAVTLLLQNEALVNATDERGCTPLHLASWSGRSDICTLLLQPSSIPAQINAQNSDGETPLHCAAQHGHCITVSVLLQDNADPTIRNLGEFSPLDLAAQYGRLDVVKQLITTHPTLVNNLILNHSPLHLASRSGHRAIVQYLLDSGFSVNLKTDAGTPLHEAATYCKTDVIKLLLDRGVMVDEEDGRGLTAADILKSLPSQKALEAMKLISDHIKGLTKVVLQDRTPSEDEYDFSPEDVPIPVPDAEPSPPVQNSDPIAQMYAKVVSDNREKAATKRQESPVSPDVSPPPIPPRAPSIRCSRNPLETARRSPPVTSCPTTVSSMTTSSAAEAVAKEQPKKPPRRRPTRLSQSSQQMESQETSQEADERSIDTDDTVSSHREETDGSEDCGAVKSVSSTSTAPRDHTKLPSPVYCNILPKSESMKSETMASEDPQGQNDTEKQGESVECSQVTEAQPSPSPDVIQSDKGDNSVQPESSSEITSDSVDVSNNTDVFSSDDWSRSEVSAIEKEKTDRSEDFSTATSDDGLSTSSVSVIGALEGTDRVQKPSSLEFENKRSSRSSVDVPLSPTGYVQPPTPDYPPPSPSTAVQGITQKINPQEKRKSKDMETLTEASILASLQNKPVKPPVKPPIKPPVKVPVKLPADNNNIQSADSSIGVEEDDQDAMLPPPKVERITSKVLETVIERAEEPNQSGSNGEITTNTQKLTEHVQLRRRISSESTSDADTETSIFAGLLRGSTPGGPRNVVSQICESDVVRQIKTKRQSTPSSFLSFDTVMEKEEDKDNIDADAVLAGLDDALKNNAAAENTNGHKSGDDGNIDESEEWANIAAIVSSYGGRFSLYADFTIFEAHMEKLLSERASNKIQSVGEWLEMLGLGQYENTLVANGFDDTDFLGGNVMEEQDLEGIGITDREHRTKLLKAAISLPKLEPIDQAKLPPSVEEWLKSLRLEQYLDTFNSHRYDTMERVIKVWELELTSVLDITSIGHRKRILASLGDRPAPERINSSSSPNIIKKTLTQGVEVISPFDHIDLYKDYTGVKSTAVDDPEVPEPSQNPLLMFGTGNDGLSQKGPAPESDRGAKMIVTPMPYHTTVVVLRSLCETGSRFLVEIQGQHIRDSTIHIRPPHLAHTTGSVRQWRHRPEILIKGCCNYTAQYLGSTLVKELNGPESTQEGISKLKKSTDVIAKIPTIMLSISYRGVKFIDAKSKKVICDHEIANIFCACQDSEHLNFFAYITKDRETQKHYCHVFSVRSRELAGEIILTLGEAFEIAYQMALKEKAEEDAMEFEKKLSPSDQEDTTSASSKASLNTV